MKQRGFLIRFILMSLWLGCNVHSLLAQTRAFPTLKELDKVVENQQMYVDKHEAELHQLKQQLHGARTDEERYKLENSLFNEYTSYIVDSALHYAQEKLVSARKLKRQDYIDDSHINIARMLVLAGMYKEAFDTMLKVNRSTMESYLETYYYSTYNLLYESMLKYSIVGPQQEEYRAKALAYKDSILQKDNYRDIYIYSDYLVEQGDYQKGLQLLLNAYQRLDPESREVAYAAYAISDFYHRQGNRGKEKQYLIVSAISDLKWGVKEYISLRRLAILLYEEGDIDRAYTYMSRSLDDAAFSNSRLRTIEVAQMLPIIENVYRVKTQDEHRRTRLALCCISVLAVFLIGMVWYVRKQMKKLAVARTQLKEANVRLQQLNDELQTVNGQLTAANDRLNESNLALSTLNKSLTEANSIKEIYIARFMTECSAYINKMDTYRKLLNRLAASGKMEELFKTLKSSSFIEDELDVFYATFDETFLHLFPDFVAQFNNLLPESEAIRPKKDGCLTTELRIFALIRLGITDSERIASFLRYSKTTIYTYRSRLRLKSLSPEHFEEQVVHIH